MKMEQRCVLMGASARAREMFVLPLKDEFPDTVEIVGAFDVNPLRLETLKENSGLEFPLYTDCDKMLAETKPDRAIVTTVDGTHHEYIIKCLESGVQPICEKPMTVDADKCRAILDAERRTGIRTVVTFNYRCTPYATAIKQALRDGMLGDILSVSFEYLLEQWHGADYFRRWHRMKQNSGGLFVHKATHHFDLINWWLEADPVEVMAFGTRRFFTPEKTDRGERCSTCSHTKTCDFYLDLNTNDLFRTFYKNCEESDGYFRDRCIYAEEIDIEDTMSATVRYDSGAMVSYMLNAHCPYTGFKASINGTKGRIEVAEPFDRLRWQDPYSYFHFYDRRNNRHEIAVIKATGTHWGGDPRLRSLIFGDDVPDPLNQRADSYQAAASILIGIAANKSIADKRNVLIDELVPLDNYRPVEHAEE